MRYNIRIKYATNFIMQELLFFSLPRHKFVYFKPTDFSTISSQLIFLTQHMHMMSKQYENIYADLNIFKNQHHTGHCNFHNTCILGIM